MIATPTSSTRTIIVQVQRNVMKEHTGIYIHIAILYGHMLRVKMNFTVTFFTISCLQAEDYIQDNAIITNICFYVIDNKKTSCFVVGSATY